MTNSNQGERQQQQANGTGEEKQQENSISTTTTKPIKTAADILSRPRLPPKKKLSTSNKKQGKKNKNNNEHQVTATEKIEIKEAVTEGHPTESIDNDQLLDQLLTQTNHLTLSSSEPTTPSTPTTAKTQQQQQPQEANGNPSRSSTISRKLHDLSEDIKEVAHAVSSSINPSSPGKLASIKPKKKPHRTKEKIAKRQAAQLQAQLDAQLESSIHPVIDHRQLEAEALLRICSSLKLQIFEIIPDGHCLFSAIADQMNVLSGQTNGLSTTTTKQEEAGGSDRYTYQTCRKLASEYMRNHPEEFIHYLPGQDDGLEAGLMSSKEYEEHCDRVRDSACWGGEPEILALSKALKFSIHVVQAFHSTIKVSEEFLEPRGNIALTISYHRKSYGLGEHYNSLRPIS